MLKKFSIEALVPSSCNLISHFDQFSQNITHLTLQSNMIFLLCQMTQIRSLRVGPFSSLMRFWFSKAQIASPINSQALRIFL